MQMMMRMTNTATTTVHMTKTKHESEKESKLEVTSQQIAHFHPDLPQLVKRYISVTLVLMKFY